MPEQLIADEGDLKHWRTELPNIIDDLGLDPFERTLYAHYKKVCGANNKPCEEAVRKTAEKTGMSTAKVSIVRRDLAKRGLIIEHEQSKQDNQIKPPVYVTIIDIWELNFFYYSFREGRPNIAGWTVTQLREWIASVYQVNAPAARLPDKREHLGSKRNEGGERLPGKQKKELQHRKNNEGTVFPFQEQTPPPLPPASDAHQHHIDSANGSDAPDPAQVVAEHLHSGYMGAPAPLPSGKQERKKWVEAGRRLLRRLPDYDLRALCYSIDAYWQHPDDFWRDKPCHDETLDLIARAYLQRQAAAPAPPPPLAPIAPDPLAVAWGAVLDDLSTRTASTTFNAHFARSQLVERQNGDITIYFPRPDTPAWLKVKPNLEIQLKQVVTAHLGDVQITYTNEVMR